MPAPLVGPLLPSPSVALVRMSALPPERARVLVVPAVVPTRTLLLAADAASVGQDEVVGLKDARTQE